MLNQFEPSTFWDSLDPYAFLRRDFKATFPPKWP